MVIDMNYRTKMDETNWGIGVQYRYNLPADFRLAADVVAYFPQNNDFGLDLGLNLQYLLPMNPKMKLYPIAGLIVSKSDRFRFEFWGWS